MMNEVERTAAIRSENDAAKAAHVDAHERRFDAAATCRSPEGLPAKADPAGGLMVHPDQFRNGMGPISDEVSLSDGQTVLGKGGFALSLSLSREVVFAKAMTFAQVSFEVGSDPLPHLRSRFGGIWSFDQGVRHSRVRWWPDGKKEEKEFCGVI
jgi:hypothetical protein